MSHFASRSSRDRAEETRGAQEVINQALTDLVSNQMRLPFQNDRVVHDNGMVNVYIPASGRDVNLHLIMVAVASVDPHARPIVQTDGTIRIDFEEQRLLAYAHKTGALVPSFRLTPSLVAYLVLLFLLCFLFYDKLVPYLAQRGTFDAVTAYFTTPQAIMQTQKTM